MRLNFYWINLFCTLTAQKCCYVPEGSAAVCWCIYPSSQALLALITWGDKLIDAWQTVTILLLCLCWNCWSFQVWLISRNMLADTIKKTRVTHVYWFKEHFFGTVIKGLWYKPADWSNNFTVWDSFYGNHLPASCSTSRCDLMLRQNQTTHPQGVMHIDNTICVSKIKY